MTKIKPICDNCAYWDSKHAVLIDHGILAEGKLRTARCCARCFITDNSRGYYEHINTEENFGCIKFNIKSELLDKPDANDSTPEPSAHCPNCGSKDHNMGSCQEPLQSCEQSETFDWRQAAKLWAAGVELQGFFDAEWQDLRIFGSVTFCSEVKYRRKPFKPSPATPDKKEEELPASIPIEDVFQLARLSLLEAKVQNIQVALRTRGIL